MLEQFSYKDIASASFIIWLILVFLVTWAIHSEKKAKAKNNKGKNTKTPHS